MADEPDGFLFDGAGASTETQQRGFVRRHKILTAFAILLTLVLLTGAGGYWWLNGKLSDIPRFDPTATLPEESRIPKSPESGDSMNILIAGIDATNSAELTSQLQAGDWQAGAARSDTNMILHIPADRSAAYLVSIPRDSYVEIYDENGDDTGDKHKINYALSLYGPAAHISTVEHLTGLRMDHMAVINWAGFKDITDALGGVTVHIPQTVYDSSQRVTWKAGDVALDGELALKYVRTRHALSNGDFGRIQRQQNFMRAMMSKLVSQGTMTDLGKLNATMNAVTGNLILDQDWTNGDLRSLSLGMRHLRSDDVEFLTTPLAPNWNQTTESDGDIVVLDKPGMQTLWAAMSRDDMGSYVPENNEQVLPDPNSVG